MSDSSTRKIIIFDPDLEALEKALCCRQVSDALAVFLRNLLQRKKWARKVNIPSGHDDVAAALVFATALKEGGLEILSELHVYFGGVTIVEKWEIVGERQEIRLLPKELFRAIDIAKVTVEGLVVRVEFTVSKAHGQSNIRVKEFDFSTGKSEVRVVPHPLFENR